MLADFLSKPLQGTLFRKFRNILMGHVDVDTLDIDIITPSTCKERVGETADTEVNTNDNTDKNTNDKTDKLVDAVYNRPKTYAEILVNDK